MKDLTPVLEDYSIFHIPDLLFKDTNSSSPLTLYSKFYEIYFKSLTSKTDNEKGEQKGRNMYQEKYLLSIRLAQYINYFYICGRVKSENFAKLIHIVYIKFISPLNLVNEAQCECTAGKGPMTHCKHGYVVMEGLRDFLNSKNIMTRKTCTSELQSFHKPKNIFTGSPIKTKNLLLKRPRCLIEKRVLKFDPRPKKYRNNNNYFGFKY